MPGERGSAMADPGFLKEGDQCEFSTILVNILFWINSYSLLIHYVCCPKMGNQISNEKSCFKFIKGSRLKKHTEEFSEGVWGVSRLPISPLFFYPY